MSRHPSSQALPPAQIVAHRVFSSVERFLHVEAVGRITLLIAAAAALTWANSPRAESYHPLWNTTVGVSLGGHTLSHPLHFWINDALMTVFFLVVVMEIRSEIHEGALANFRLAALP